MSTNIRCVKGKDQKNYYYDLTTGKRIKAPKKKSKIECVPSKSTKNPKKKSTKEKKTAEKKKKIVSKEKPATKKSVSPKKKISKVKKEEEFSRAKFFAEKSKKGVLSPYVPYKTKTPSPKKPSPKKTPPKQLSPKEKEKILETVIVNLSPSAQKDVNKVLTHEKKDFSEKTKEEVKEITTEVVNKSKSPAKKKTTVTWLGRVFGYKQEKSQKSQSPLKLVPSPKYLREGQTPEEEYEEPIRYF